MSSAWLLMASSRLLHRFSQNSFSFCSCAACSRMGASQERTSVTSGPSRDAWVVYPHNLSSNSSICSSLTLGGIGFLLSSRRSRRFPHLPLVALHPQEPGLFGQHATADTAAVLALVAISFNRAFSAFNPLTLRWRSVI